MHARPVHAPGIAALVAATGLLAPGGSARAGAQPPAAQAPGDQRSGQPTFRAGVRLAIHDAIVTDDKGRHVTDLTAADFEVVERGTRQTVRQAAYVHALSPAAAPGAAKDAPDVAPVAFRGSLYLGDALPAGAYVLQLTVAEDGGKAASSTQWADFEVR